LITPWCKARVHEPQKLGDMIQAGPDEREILYVLQPAWFGDRWREVSTGRSGRVMRLAGDRAILLVPRFGADLEILYPGNRAPRPLAGALGCPGWITVVPDGSAIDCGTCARGEQLSCKDLEVDRFSIDGVRLSQTIFHADGACEFRWSAVKWYDHLHRPYVLALCGTTGATLTTSSDDGTHTFTATGGATSDPAFWWSAIGKYELLDPKKFAELRCKPGESMQP
jgi:hypothetical protein